MFQVCYSIQSKTIKCLNGFRFTVNIQIERKKDKERRKRLLSSILVHYNLIISTFVFFLLFSLSYIFLLDFVVFFFFSLFFSSLSLDFNLGEKGAVFCLSWVYQLDPSCLKFVTFLGFSSDFLSLGVNSAQKWFDSEANLVLFRQ